MLNVADIRPFRGIHYQRSRLRDDWTRALCPVYDIISPQQQEELYLKSDYNFVRLEAGRELPQDTPADSRYSRAAATLAGWLKSGVLETDDRPAIYLHDQSFTHQGKRWRRRGIIVRIKLEEWESKVVRPHESTLSEAKSDRLSLLWAVQANTSPVLSLYEDKSGEVRSVLAAEAKRRPLLDLKTISGEAHRVWGITDEPTLGRLQALFAGKPVYIADGHHRYESALTYRRQRRAANGEGEQPFDFVMMTLVDFADPGLLILPPHRLVRGLGRSALDELKAKLTAVFEVDDHSYSGPETLAALEKSGGDAPVRLVVFGLSKDRVTVLRLADPAKVASMMPYFHSDLYRRLEVSVIDHVVMENLLGLTREREKTSLAYSYDRQDAVKRVLDGEYQLAFLLGPIKADVIRAIADLGDKMPRKSTYFYPKVPAGLIVNRLV